MRPQVIDGPLAPARIELDLGAACPIDQVTLVFEQLLDNRPLTTAPSGRRRG
jgi:hypothetical protein